MVDIEIKHLYLPIIIWSVAEIVSSPLRDIIDRLVIHFVELPGVVVRQSSCTGSLAPRSDHTKNQ